MHLFVHLHPDQAWSGSIIYPRNTWCKMENSPWTAQQSMFLDSTRKPPLRHFWHTKHFFAFNVRSDVKALIVTTIHRNFKSKSKVISTDHLYPMKTGHQSSLNSSISMKMMEIICSGFHRQHISTQMNTIIQTPNEEILCLLEEWGPVFPVQCQYSRLTAA